MLIVLRGLGINLCGGMCLIEGGLVFFFKYMNWIFEIDEENLIVIV